MTEQEMHELCDKYNAGQHYKEACFFWEACKKIDPKVVVEIGLYGGGNLKLLSMLVTDSNGLVVGMEYDWTHWDQRKWEISESICPVKLIDGDTHHKETLVKLKEILNGRQIDVLFIDGDHTCAGCLMDYDTYSPLVRKGGIIGIHDLKDGGDPGQNKAGEFNVKGAWDRICDPKNNSLYDRYSFNCVDGFGVGYIIK